MPYKDPEKRRAYHREYLRKWQRENPEKCRAYEKKWVEAHPEQRAAIKRRARYKDPAKYRAGNRLRAAIYAGKIKRGDACETCGTDEDIQGHHDDYSKPFDVRWLCRKHHMELHRAHP